MLDRQLDQMNPIDFLAHFINILVACTAIPSHEINLSGKVYQVQTWVCQTDPGTVIVRAWSHQCDTGHTKYWSRHSFMEVGDTAVYVNRFGEVMVGYGAQVGDAYEGPCGS